MFRVAALCVLMVSVFLPVVRAGDVATLPILYQPNALDGYVKFAGKRIDLPVIELRNALLKNGFVVVKDGRIPVQKVKWEKVLEKLHFKGITGGSVASGPSEVILKGNSQGYQGRTRRPLVIVQRGKIHFVKVTAIMRTNLETKIVDGKLTMTAPVEVKALGLTARGVIRLEATQVELPPRL